jgi:type I restriction enzyme S subunit
MIADLKPYPKYKESGLLWLGRVPAHWSITRIKTMLRELDCRSTSGEGTLLSLTRVRGLIPHTERTDKVHSAKTLVGYKRYQPGEIVMNRMQAWSGMFGAGTIPGIVSPDYAVFTILGDHQTKFVLERLKSPDLVGQFAIESKGIGSGFNRLYTDCFGPIAITLPPPSEQTAILRFLDLTNGRLGRTIRAKRKVIALLNEQKQAIIHRAVTLGLDPTAPLKPSGIPWLGEIPQHWDTIRSKWLFSPRKDLALPDDVQLSATQAYGVIPQSEFEEKVGRRVVKISMHLEKRRHVEKDDFVISMRSFQGGLERAWASGAIRSSYVVLKSGQGVDTDFFAYLFKSRGYIRALQATGDFIRDGQDLNFTNFCRVDLPLIPDKEQRAIAKLIADSTRGLDSAVSRLGQEIELLSEYRTRLVADVVTGKLDVREAAAGLPNEAIGSEAAPDTEEMCEHELERIEP